VAACLYSDAAYSHRPFPRTTCWSECGSVCLFVCLSVGLSICPVDCEKTLYGIRMPFGVVGRTGPRMRPGSEVRDRSTGRGNYGGKYGARHCNQMAGLRHSCAKVREPWELRFGLVRGMGRGICITWGSTSCKGRGLVWRGCSSIFTPTLLLGLFYNSTASRVGQPCRRSAHAESLEVQAYRPGEHAGVACGVASKRSNAALLPHHFGQT